MKRYLAGIVIVMAASWLALPARAAMAPEYLSSEPADGAKMHQAPEEVSVTFSEPLDPSSTMKVENHCDEQVDDGNVEVSANEMRVGVDSNTSGMYHVTYYAKGIGGITGDNLGQFSFTVHGGKGCDGGSGHDHDREVDRHDGHDRDGEDRDHNGMDQGTNDHDGMDHDTGSRTGDSGSHDSMSHSNGRSDKQGAHGSGKKHRNHKARDRNPPIAAGPDNVPPPDDQAVMLALGLSVLLGAAGGGVLRASAGR